MVRMLIVVPFVVFCGFGASVLDAADQNPRILRVGSENGEEFATVQAAIDAAPDGAIIRIGPGTFQGPVQIRKSITLEGAGADRTFLTADWFTLTELLIDDKRTPPEDRAHFDQLRQVAIEREKGEGPITRQLWEEFGPKPTLSIQNTKEVLVRGLSVSMPGTVWKGGWQKFPMVRLENAAAILKECAFVGSAVEGVRIGGVSAITMQSCLVGGIRSSGVVAETSAGSNIQVTDCDVRGCGYAGIQIKGPGDVTVARCRISHIEFHGIRYDDASPTITGNVFSEIQRAGIYVDGKTRGIIRDNLFLDCGTRGTQDRISHNTFVRKTGPSPAWRVSAAVSSHRAGALVIQRNVITGYDHALVLYSSDKTPLKRGATTFEQNMTETTKSPILNIQSMEPKSSFEPRGEPEYHDLPLPEGNWRMPVTFANPEQGDFSLARDVDWPDRHLGARNHAALSTPWPEQSAERAMLDRIREVETPKR